MTLTREEFKTFFNAVNQFTESAKERKLTNYRCSQDQEREIGVARALNFPYEGMTTATTLGLVHESWTELNFPDRIELVQAWDSVAPEYERLLVVVADSILIQRRYPNPGAIYFDAVKIANLPDLAQRMPHALVLFPYVWHDAFERVDVDGVRVWWLQIVPIFDDERRFIQEKGFQLFENLLRAKGAFFERLSRKSYLEL
jgi:hypothetical protein